MRKILLSLKMSGKPFRQNNYHNNSPISRTERREKVKKEDVNGRSEKVQREEIKEKLTQTICNVANNIIENKYQPEIEADVIEALANLASTRASMI